MAYIDREYVQGDEIKIKTQVHHDASIAGIEVTYVLEGSEEPTIYLTKGKIGGQSAGTPLNHAGPYLNGEVTIEGSIPADQTPGVYVLGSVTWTTANKQKLEALQVPESRIRVTEVPREIFVNGWEMEGGKRVGEFE